MQYKNHLQSIKATLINYPTMKELESYIPEFVSITWLKKLSEVDSFLKSRSMTREDCVHEMFNFRTLPTALETVRLTFFLEGLDLTNVTHTIRHRLFSFSAQSTDPVSMSEHAILVNDAFEEDEELQEKSRKLCQDANDLYDLALAKGLTYYDARHYQPRAKEAKYMMSGSIKDFLMFIKVRLGNQNQPHSDNVLALRIRQAILEVYPFLNIPTESVEYHYVNAITEKMNLNTYPPSTLHEKVLDKKGVDYKSIKFDHPKKREDYPCSVTAQKVKDEIIDQTTKSVNQLKLEL